MLMTRLVVKAGKDATLEEREKFKELVLRDPQVAPNGLSGRIAQAHLLAFLYKDGELVATGAVKCNPEHQAHLAEDAPPLPHNDKAMSLVGRVVIAGSQEKQLCQMAADQLCGIGSLPALPRSVASFSAA
jgi:hypothetical protein